MKCQSHVSFKDKAQRFIFYILVLQFCKNSSIELYPQAMEFCIYSFLRREELGGKDLKWPFVCSRTSAKKEASRKL